MFRTLRFYHSFFKFLSTPSSRRATGAARHHATVPTYFYPRPPRGGRPLCDHCRLPPALISIHALREEGDTFQREQIISEDISIHALREEGDISSPAALPQGRYFYPRPPRGGRPGQKRPSTAHQLPFLSTPSARRATTTTSHPVSLRRYFYPRPPRGGRLFSQCSHSRRHDFYPRPPRGGRRQSGCSDKPDRHISIHALREEGDCFAVVPFAALVHFYPRPPRGGRQQKQRENTLLLSHYTPPCTNCKEMSVNQTAKLHRYLRKRLVFRCEASRKTMCAADSHWPDIKRSARCLGQILGAVQRARPWSGSCCPAGRTADCPRQGRSGRSALL